MGVCIGDAPRQRADPLGARADEIEAMRSIAAAMTDRPAEVLPLLVRKAMALTGGSSAGLSLCEAEPAPGVFRWRHVHGALARFEGATAPRGDSPSSITLDRNRATLARHPERQYAWIAEHGLAIPELLLVPLHIGGEEPLGTLWIVAEDAGHFHRGHADMARDLARFAGQALTMIREQQRLRNALGEQERVAGEMGHRLKNLFAMTDGMIRGSARNAPSVDDLAAALSGRLHALAKAHALVQERTSGLDGDRVTDLAELVAAVLKAHELSGGGSPRIAIEGPALPCGAHATTSLALMLHELATNSAKFGALRLPGGQLDIRWRIEGDELVLDWAERDGPPVIAPPSRQGFGTSLVARTVQGQFAGTIVQDWRAEGLAMTIRLNKAALTR